VLLSSHILSEVEAVCDRVAMLRTGRIIESGRLDVLRSLARVRVHAELAAAVPDGAHLEQLEGVSNVVVDGRTVECDVTGSIQPLMQLLTDAGIVRLTTREPSLEELFISHYGDAPPPSAPRIA
jgi:ABC-2 type transport system ATP-binding protein